MSEGQNLSIARSPWKTKLCKPILEVKVDIKVNRGPCMPKSHMHTLEKSFWWPFSSKVKVTLTRARSKYPIKQRLYTLWPLQEHHVARNRRRVVGSKDRTTVSFLSVRGCRETLNPQKHCFCLPSASTSSQAQRTSRRPRTGRKCSRQQESSALCRLLWLDSKVHCNFSNTFGTIANLTKCAKLFFLQASGPQSLCFLGQRWTGGLQEGLG